MAVIREGLARIHVPKEQSKPKKSPAFYNPRMELNRDLSIATANVFFARKKIKICEPLGATGVRGIRYALEIPNSEIYIGDIRTSSFNLIKRNLKLNKAKNAHAFHGHAVNLLSERKYDLVDIDPFGTPSPYINAALEAIKTNGLLCFTATDMRPLCGVSPRGPMPKYDNASSLRTEYCHETAVRVLLGLIARRARKQNKKIMLLLSLSIDHYVRIFLKIQTGKNSEIGYLYHCFKCGNRKLLKGKFEKKKCKCDSIFTRAGPLWIGKLWDKTFCQKLRININDKHFGTLKRLTKILDLIINESDGKPLYYEAREFYKEIPKMNVILKEKKATRTHFSPTGIRVK